MAEEEKIGTGDIRCRVRRGKFAGHGPGTIVWLNNTQLQNFRDQIEPYSEDQEKAEKQAHVARKKADQEAKVKETKLAETHEAAEEAKAVAADTKK